MNTLTEEKQKLERLLIQTFQFLYARTIVDHLPDVAKADCYGCEVDHPSQTHHTCLMWTEIEQLDLYFDQIFQKLIPADIITLLQQQVSLMDIPEDDKVAFNKLVESDHWREKHIPSRDILHQYAEKLILLNERVIVD